MADVEFSSKTPSQLHGFTNFQSKRFKQWDASMKVDAYSFLDRLMRKIARRAIDNLRENKNIDTNALVESVQAKVVFVKGRGKSDGRIWAGVGIDRNVSKTKKYKRKETLPDIRVPIHYAHLIENGFTHLPDGTKVEAKPFLRPAVNLISGGNEAIQKKLAEIIFNTVKGVENTVETFKMDWEL
jgi:hypothetical protein